ncbi:hypothetical protein Q4E93_13075 [Flavitalea sp. BT771]|uniref:hypothetical protein n=1 Tax=Flavitalea sp. BT771 TaxID=3063329 RepID=UPI0026E3AC17|nr:hypothetical protein [Flavitalea sp. BT771]MDO6431530.1 hypothetical protein [Flavitalea sp. BT771]MDV6220438.1 hypothetical protein [Flavitalea sp. BT771]
MKIGKFPTENGAVFTFSNGDYEYVNPIEKVREVYITQCMLLAENGIKHPRFAKEDLSNEETLQQGQEEGVRLFKLHFSEAMSLPIHEELFKLLSLHKKKRQLAEINKIAALGLFSNVLMAFIYRAYLDYGYTYSMYTGERLPTGLDPNEWPSAAIVEKDGSTRVWGETNLTNGQIRAAMQQRSYVVGRFLDKGPEWHCFIYTMKAVNGQERGEGPHIHYISNAWGHDRSTVVQQIKIGDYRLNTDNHIPYIKHA